MNAPVPGAVEVVLYRAKPGVADHQLVEESTVQMLHPLPVRVYGKAGA